MRKRRLVMDAEWTRYPPLLYQPFPLFDDRYLDVLRAQGQVAGHKFLITALDNHRKKILALLFDHYGIRRNDPNRWKKLAKWLANHHVPAMQPGAPSRLVSNVIDRIIATRPRGRPQDKSSLEQLAALRYETLRVIAENELHGRGSQRRAAQILCAEHAKQTMSRNPTPAEVRRVEKLLSKAKAKFPQNRPEDVVSEILRILSN